MYFLVINRGVTGCFLRIVYSTVHTILLSPPLTDHQEVMRNVRKYGYEVTLVILIYNVYMLLENIDIVPSHPMHVEEK